MGVAQPNNMWDESDDDDDQDANQWGVQPLATEMVEDSQRSPNKADAQQLATLKSELEQKKSEVSALQNRLATSEQLVNDRNNELRKQVNEVAEYRQ